MELRQYHGYLNQFILYNTDGASFTSSPLTCKSFFKDAIAHYLFPNEFATRTDECAIGSGKLNLDEIATSIFVRTKEIGQHIENFIALITQVESMLALDSYSKAWSIPSHIDGKIISPMMTSPNPWWFKNPITTSAYYLLLRLSCNLCDVPADIDAVITYALCKSPDAHLNYSRSADYGYLARASNNGNWAGLMNKSLRVFKREDYCDFILNTHVRGLAHYNALYDEQCPIETKELMLSKNL